MNKFIYKNVNVKIYSKYEFMCIPVNAFISGKIIIENNLSQKTKNNYIFAFSAFNGEFYTTNQRIQARVVDDMLYIAYLVLEKNSLNIILQLFGDTNQAIQISNTTTDTYHYNFFNNYPIILSGTKGSYLKLVKGKSCIATISTPTNTIACTVDFDAQSINPSTIPGMTLSFTDRGDLDIYSATLDQYSVIANYI